MQTETWLIGPIQLSPWERFARGESLRSVYDSCGGGGHGYNRAQKEWEAKYGRETQARTDPAFRPAI